MKLLTKNTLVYLTLSLVVFSFGGMLFYKQLRNIMQEESGEILELKKAQIKQYVKHNKSLPKQDIAPETMYFDSVLAAKPEKINDTLLYSSVENEMLPYRQLTFSLKVENQWYEAHVCQSIFEMDDLIETIRNAFVTILIFFTIILLSVNILFTRWIWKPFFKTIAQIKNYNTEQLKIIPKENINTREFRELNEALNQMTERIFTDITHLKNFTENAAHELQTPLAILQTKIENLLQDKDLYETQLGQLSQMQQTINRLKKINQALIMLTKIENHQFVAREKIDLKTIIDQKLEWMGELLEMKSIKVSSNLKPCPLLINEDLADIMISNLLNNAIKYCPEGGEISLDLQADKFSIGNQGEKLRASEKDLFKRFHKDNPDSDSTGLGLALVDSIARENGFSISYNYQQGTHFFELKFK